MGNFAIEKVAESTGIELAKARSIWIQFQGHFEGVTDAAAKVANLEITDVSQKDEMALARKTRLELRGIRVAAEKTKKELKADILKEGKFIDATFRLIADTTKPLEDDLKEKEEFAKRKEAERIAQLVSERWEALSALGVDTQFLDLAKMSEEDFGALLQKSELEYEERLEAERKAEEERVAREKTEAEEKARIEAENARLRAEAEEQARQLAEARANAEAALAAERAKLEAERQRRDEADKREREAREAAEKAARDAREAAAKEEREKVEAAIRKAEEESAAAQKALREKEEDDERRRQEEAARVEALRQAEEAERQRLAAASDKEKLSAYFDAVLAVEVPTVSSDTAKGIVMSMSNVLQLCVSRTEGL